ncbi:MAG: hypothetical protein II947_10540 [Bacteroidaceae bacterium]|nr:hypothetical protein [Bacteroidaceae bacterium]
MTSKLNRGWRNNNPMNIRFVAANKWRGKVSENRKKDRAYEEFTNVVWGWRAAFYLLMKYYFKNKLKTPRMIITKFAPPSENNTDAYVHNVMEFMHKNGFPNLEENATLANPYEFRFQWVQFMKAMTIQESGIMPADTKDSQLMEAFIESAINQVLILTEFINLNNANK